MLIVGLFGLLIFYVGENQIKRALPIFAYLSCMDFSMVYQNAIQGVGRHTRCMSFSMPIVKSAQKVCVSCTKKTFKGFI